MREEIAAIWQMLKKGQWRALFFEPTDSTLLQFCRYIPVGGFSFIADSLVLRLCEHVLGLDYRLAAAIGFLFGVTVNYYLSGLLSFAGKKARVGKKAELTIFLLISLIGLGLTELLMIFFTEVIGLHYMLSKVIAAALVLIWNYLAKKVLYKQKGA